VNQAEAVGATFSPAACIENVVYKNFKKLPKFKEKEIKFFWPSELRLC
jgi:hypothetical protein